MMASTVCLARSARSCSRLQTGHSFALYTSGCMNFQDELHWSEYPVFFHLFRNGTLISNLVRQKTMLPARRSQCDREPEHPPTRELASVHQSACGRSCLAPTFPKDGCGSALPPPRCVSGRVLQPRVDTRWFVSASRETSLPRR